MDVPYFYLASNLPLLNNSFLLSEFLFFSLYSCPVCLLSLPLTSKHCRYPKLENHHGFVSALSQNIILPGQLYPLIPPRVQFYLLCTMDDLYLADVSHDPLACSIGP
jgi:hypothetical protein